MKCNLKKTLDLIFFSENWKYFFKQNKLESWQGKQCCQLERESELSQVMAYWEAYFEGAFKVQRLIY